MHASGALAVLLVLLVCILVSGCTSDTAPGPEATPVPTPLPATLHRTVPTTVPVILTTATPLPTPEPVQTLPPEREISLALTKDRPTSDIHLLFQGGPGSIFVSRILMRVYTSDTGYTEYIMSEGRQPVAGDEIVAPGTRGGDRCEVFVISAGSRYKVMDERVYGGMYY